MQLTLTFIVYDQEPKATHDNILRIHHSMYSKLQIPYHYNLHNLGTNFTYTVYVDLALVY